LFNYKKVIKKIDSTT